LYISQPAQKPVVAASSGECGHDQSENCAEAGRPEGVGQRRRSEERDADLVREARRSRVLQWPLTEAWLDEREVGDAREAIAAPEPEADRQLRGQEAQERPPAGQDGDR